MHGQLCRRQQLLLLVRHVKHIPQNMHEASKWSRGGFRSKTSSLSHLLLLLLSKQPSTSQQLRLGLTYWTAHATVLEDPRALTDGACENLSNLGANVAGNLSPNLSFVSVFKYLCCRRRQ